MSSATALPGPSRLRVGLREPRPHVQALVQTAQSSSRWTRWDPRTTHTAIPLATAPTGPPCAEVRAPPPRCAREEPGALPDDIERRCELRLGRRMRQPPPDQAPRRRAALTAQPRAIGGSEAYSQGPCGWSRSGGRGSYACDSSREGSSDRCFTSCCVGSTGTAAGRPPI